MQLSKISQLSFAALLILLQSAHSLPTQNSDQVLAVRDFLPNESAVQARDEQLAARDFEEGGLLSPRANEQALKALKKQKKELKGKIATLKEALKNPNNLKRLGQNPKTLQANLEGKEKQYEDIKKEIAEMEGGGKGKGDAEPEED